MLCGGDSLCSGPDNERLQVRSVPLQGFRVSVAVSVLAALGFL